jgi:hypothetical protein
MAVLLRGYQMKIRKSLSPAGLTHSYTNARWSWSATVGVSGPRWYLVVDELEEDSREL